MNNKNSTHIYWVDFVRVCAIVGVVCLHMAAPLLHEYNEASLGRWWVGNIFDSATRVCVPIFFMLTGFLLLGKQEIISEYISKRFSKIVFL